MPKSTLEIALAGEAAADRRMDEVLRELDASEASSRSALHAVAAGASRLPDFADTLSACLYPDPDAARTSASADEIRARRRAVSSWRPTIADRRDWRTVHSGRDNGRGLDITVFH